MRIVIVGGVAGGASAAARIRRLSEDAEIVLCERGEYPSFANCGMPYYIGGKIEHREKLLGIARSTAARSISNRPADAYRSPVDRSLGEDRSRS